MNLEELANKKNADVSDIVEYLESKGCRIPSYGQYELSMDELRCVDYKMLREECTRLRELTITDNIITHVLVDNIADLGIFVNFPNGKKGLIHYSQIKNWNIDEAKSRYSKNQWIKVFVLSIREDGKINLSLKKLTKVDMEAEQERRKVLAQKYASKLERGAIYEAEVVELSKHEARISINGIDGYIKKDELNWNENDSVKESLFVGEIIYVVFLEYTDGKLLFGLKYLDEKPYDDKLYDLSLNDLLKYAGHDSNVFIGQAKQSGDFAFIENLYSCDENQKGKLLVDPIYGYKLKAVVINQFEDKIAEGEYYKVKLSRLVDKIKRLERNQLFQFTAEIIAKVGNPYKSDVDLAFCKHTSPATNSSIANLLDEVGLNMYSSPERMFFELIQNADDAASENGVIINIDKIDNYLVFTHNGFHFSKNDFESIVSAAKSTKTSKEKTGYKGIGFKSVFTNSQQVYVHSGGYHFLFDKNTELYDDFDGFYFRVNKKYSKEERDDFIRTFQSEKKSFRGVKDIPWQLLPIWYDAIPDTLEKSAFAKNQKVSFALNIKNQKIEDYVKAIEFLFDNPKFILFLRHTNRLDLKFANKTISKDVKDGIVTIKNSFSSKRKEELIKKDFYGIPISNEAFKDKNIDIQIKEITNRQGEKENKFYDNSNQELEDIPDRIASSQTTTISFVANYDDGNITENKGNSLYAYLPMNEHRFRFPFFINADFVLAANRETLLDNPWNYYLLSNIGVLLVKWVAELAQKGENNCLKLLPLQYFDDSTLDIEQLAQSFNSAYRTALESEAFILNHNGELAKQEEIIIDKTGLSEIIGADLFCKLLDIEKCLPSEKIDSKILEKDIFEHIELLKFDDVIDSITNNSDDFNDWYISASDEQKKDLYKWIEDNNIWTREDNLKSFVSNLPLFQFGEEYKSCQEIDSSDYIITTDHIEPIKGILSKLGFICSDNVFNDSHPLFEYIALPNEEDLFKAIKDCDFSGLEADEKRTLFFALADFDGVGEAKLKKEIALFKNMKGAFKALGEMVANNKEYPIWLNDYVIAKEECTQGLEKYLISDEFVFQEIVQTHYSDLEYTTILDLYNHFKAQWTSDFTKKLIDKYGTTEELLNIVERTDGVKHYFIEKYGKINFGRESTIDSIEYKLVQLALSSNYDINNLKKSIYIDNKNITEFTIAPEVSISIDKEYLFPLSEILTTQSDNYTTFNQIKNLLSKIEGSDVLFSLTKMKNSDVRSQLKALSTPAQYAFYVCYNIANNYRYTISITDEQFVTNVLDYFFDKEIGVLGRYIQYFSNQKITGHFINSDDYTLESERLSNTIRQWANDEEKEKFLIALGVKGNLSDEIKRRRAFLNNEPISLSYSNSITSEITAFLNWCITLETPFIKDNQVKVLKEMFSRLNIKTGYYNDDYQNIKEWDNCRYIESVRNKLSIFCIDNEMPKRGVYNNVHLFTEYVGNYVCLTPNRLYVNIKDKNIETILMSVCDDRNIPFTKEDWTKLFMVSVEKLNEKENEIIEQKEKIKSLSKENRRKDEKIKELEKELEKYKNVEVKNNDENTRIQLENPPTPTIEVVKPGDIGEKTKWEAQLEAQKRLIQEFPQWTFPSDYGKSDDNGKPYNFSTIEVVDEDDNTIPVVLKSYKKSSEPFKINTEEWDYLIREQAVLLIYTGTDIKRIYVRDLIRKQSSIAISFSTENLDIEDKVNAFADSLHYFNELHFDFDSFNISSRVQSAKELYQRNKRAFFANDNTEDDI